MSLFSLSVRFFCPRRHARLIRLLRDDTSTWTLHFSSWCIFKWSIDFRHHHVWTVLLFHSNTWGQVRNNHDRWTEERKRGERATKINWIVNKLLFLLWHISYNLCIAFTNSIDIEEGQRKKEKISFDSIINRNRHRQRKKKCNQFTRGSNSQTDVSNRKETRDRRQRWQYRKKNSFVPLVSNLYLCFWWWLVQSSSVSLSVADMTRLESSALIDSKLNFSDDENV